MNEKIKKKCGQVAWPVVAFVIGVIFAAGIFYANQAAISKEIDNKLDVGIYTAGQEHIKQRLERIEAQLDRIEAKLK